MCLQKRIRKHKTDAKLNRSGCFWSAIREFGFNAFEWEILDENVPKHLLDEFEQDAISVHNALHPNGYNLQTGGSIGYSASQEMKLKLSAASKNRKRKSHTEETKQKMSESAKGRKHSEESKQKMSESWKQRPPVSEETRRKTSESLKGHRHTEESKQKMSEIAKARQRVQKDA
jgi:group I intron endonuclease